MNAYEARQEERRERLENAAERARREAEARFGTAKRIGDGIPFGQPILVGHHSEGRPIEGDGFAIVEDLEENRILITFDDKPDEARRTMLKGYGFKWSPTRGAWVRMLNESARYAAQQVAKKLEA